MNRITLWIKLLDRARTVTVRSPGDPRQSAKGVNGILLNAFYV